MVPHGRRYTVSFIQHRQSSSHEEMPAPAEPAGTPWCWGLGGLEPMVMVPIHRSVLGLLVPSGCSWSPSSGCSLLG